MTVRALLADGADVEVADQYYASRPLHLAAAGGHEGVVRMLVEAGADTNAVTPRNLRPLHMAALKGHEAVARMLLKAGADVEVADQYSASRPLHLAAAGGHEGVARMLVEAGAEIGAADGDGRSALCVAAQNGHEAVVSLLVEAGADVEAATTQGVRPLFAAARAGHEAVVRVLAEAGADARATDVHGLGALQAAIAKGHEAVVRVLLEAGADVEAVRNGLRPLHIACRLGDEAVVRVLLEAGACVDSDSRAGVRPCHRTRFLPILRLLAAHGADLTARTRAGESALHFATSGSVAKWHLAHAPAGASAPNETGWRPFDVCRNDTPRIVLVAAGASSAVLSDRAKQRAWLGLDL